MYHVSSSRSGICIIAVGVSELIVEVGQTEAAAATGIDIYEYNPLHNILYSITLDMSNLKLSNLDMSNFPIFKDIYEYNPLHNILYSINLDMSHFSSAEVYRKVQCNCTLVSDLLMNTKLYSGQRTLNISVKSLKIRYFSFQFYKRNLSKSQFIRK